MAMTEEKDTAKHRGQTFQVRDPKYVGKHRKAVGEERTDLRNKLGANRVDRSDKDK